jgi:hypothetical protein
MPVIPLIFTMVLSVENWKLFGRNAERTETI